MAPSFRLLLPPLIIITLVSRDYTTHGFIPHHCQKTKSLSTTLLMKDKTTTRLFSGSGGGGKARFTGIQQDATSTLDYVLSAIVSDVGSITLGVLGLLLVLGNRLLDQPELGNVPEALGQETRSDLLAVLACGAVLLNGVSKLDVTSALAESVVLDGTPLAQPAFHQAGGNLDKTSLQWATTSLMTATPAKTVVLLKNNGEPSQWNPITMAGIVPSKQMTFPNMATTPILDRFLGGKQTETYLPTLQALPGKAEFTYLPSNTQEVLLLPVVGNNENEKSMAHVLVLGSNTAKSFTPRDVAWCQVMAKRMHKFL